MHTSSITVDNLQGVWDREWIEANGERTSTSRVLWAQADNLFVDIRIPHDRPDLNGSSCLADLSTEDLALLKKAEGFAGHIDLCESVCTWHREINWQGPPTGIDAGALHFNSDGALIETGVHANYAECWQKTILPMLTAHRFAIGTVQGILVFSDSQFFLGVGVPIEQQPPIEDTSIIERFSSEYSYGLWNGTTGIAELHTNPFCEGTEVLKSDEDGLVWHRQDFHGNPVSTLLIPG